MSGIYFTCTYIHINITSELEVKGGREGYAQNLMRRRRGGDTGKLEKVMMEFKLTDAKKKLREENKNLREKIRSIAENKTEQELQKIVHKERAKMLKYVLYA